MIYCNWVKYALPCSKGFADFHFLFMGKQHLPFAVPQTCVRTFFINLFIQNANMSQTTPFSSLSRAKEIWSFLNPNKRRITFFDDSIWLSLNRPTPLFSINPWVYFICEAIKIQNFNRLDVHKPIKPVSLLSKLLWGQKKVV